MILTSAQCQPAHSTERAFKAIRTYADRPSEEDFIDIITDLYHLADEWGVNMESVARCAQFNYQEESK